MNTLATDPHDVRTDALDEPLPGRPRRRLVTRVTLPLLGLLLASVGFLVGIEVEKGHASGGSGTGAGAGRAGFSASTGSRSGGPSGGFGGFSGTRPGGAPGTGAGGGTSGTISSISGRTLYLKTTSGNTVAVHLDSATTLKKEESVSSNSVRPGDAITVEGVSAHGAITAASISDTGHVSSSSTGGSSS